MLPLFSPCKPSLYCLTACWLGATIPTERTNVLVRGMEIPFHWIRHQEDSNCNSLFSSSQHIQNKGILAVPKPETLRMFGNLRAVICKQKNNHLLVWFIKLKSDTKYCYGLHIFWVRLTQAREQKELLKDKRIMRLNLLYIFFLACQKCLVFQEAGSFRSSLPK